MGNYYEAPADIVDSCVTDYQSITGVVVNPDDLSRDEVITFWWFGMALAHWYSALQAAASNAVPQTADVNGLNSALQARGLPTQIQPQSSNGTITVIGPGGEDFPVGQQASRNLTGDKFVSTVDMVFPEGGSMAVPFQSLDQGQDYNIGNTDEPFTLTAPPAGVTAACVSATPFSDGRNIETLEAMFERIQAFDQNEEDGGNLAAYEQFAQDASSLVVSATAVSCPSGPDTVGVVISSGTTDIAAAVAAGEPVVRVPSDDLVTAVQAYIETQNPTTDVVTVSGVTEDEFDVTFSYALLNESLRPTTDPQIKNIIAIYLYTAKSGYTMEPTDIERLVDASIGFLIKSRRCSNLGGGVPQYTIPFGTLVKPGTVTLDTYS